MKLVSILIPAYKPTYFRECLTSAIAQSWPNKEIIVSDDCPTDEIKQICSDYSGLVHYVRNSMPGENGRNNVRNLCQRAHGEYLKFLLDDDVLHPFCVQFLVEALEYPSDERITLAFSPRELIDEKNHSIELINLFGVTSRAVLPSFNVLHWLAVNVSNPIGELTTVLFRKEDIIQSDGTLALFKIGDFSVKGLGDVALFIHLLEKGNAAIAPETLSYFRRHHEANTNPTYNKDVVHIVGDWRHVVDYAVARNLLNFKERVQAYRKLIKLFSRWCDRVPDSREFFQNQINQLSSNISHNESFVDFLVNFVRGKVRK